MLTMSVAVASIEVICTGREKPVSTGPITVRGCIHGDQAAYTLTQKGTGTVFVLEEEISRD